MESPIILIHYINFTSDVPPELVAQTVQSYTAAIAHEKNGIVDYVIPQRVSRNVKSTIKVECINPKLISDEEYQKVTAVINDLQKKVKEFCKGFQVKLDKNGN